MIPTLQFGRTGHESTRILFGGAAFGKVTQEEADATMELLIKSGVNHLDTAASYGDSELRIGPWMENHRDTFFLATKTGSGPTRPRTIQIRRSLERLRVDHVDLIQLHNLVEPDEWETALGEGGALQAAIQARDEGLVRFIGVTGHGTTIAKQHRRALDRFDFDSVLLPYNYAMMQNPQYAADFEELAAFCEERNVALQTIKSITRAPWGDRPHTASTWYEPLTDQLDIDLTVHWVFGLEKAFLNTVGDIHVLPKVLDAAESFVGRPSDDNMSLLAGQREMEPLFV
ncbi:MAG: aldo/keto reductase [Chloroflexia bacterium]